MHCGCRLVLILLFAGLSASAQTPGEGVLLPAKDYQKLLDELEAAKKAKAAAKPASPSACKIDCEFKRITDRSYAVLTLTYQFRTTQPRSTVLLGGQRAFAVKASLDDGGLPVLESTPDGLVAMIDAAGEHSLTLTLETAIVPRVHQGDIGIDIGLPSRRDHHALARRARSRR